MWQAGGRAEAGRLGVGVVSNLEIDHLAFVVAVQSDPIFEARQTGRVMRFTSACCYSDHLIVRVQLPLIHQWKGNEFSWNLFWNTLTKLFGASAGGLSMLRK